MAAAIRLLIAVALIFTFAACESDDNDDSEVVTITVAAPQDVPATTRAVSGSKEHRAGSAGPYFQP